MSDSYQVEPFLEPEEAHDETMSVPIGDINAPPIDPTTGHIILPDGNILVPVGGMGEGQREPPPDELPFDANLADYLPDDKLNQIADDILRGIKDDDESRSEWLETFRYGIKLLGLKVEQGAGDVGGSTGLEAMHKTTHPLLLEAVIRATAEAKSALLPSSGPVKIRDDRPQKPQMPPMMGHNGGPPMDMAGAPDGQAMGAMEMPPQGFQNGGRFGFAAGGIYDDQPDWMQRMPMDERNQRIGMAQGGVPPSQGFGQPGADMAGGQQQGSPININVNGQQKPDDQQGGTQGAPGSSEMSPVPPVPAEPDRDLLAEAFEKDFNHYMTTIAQEYYPDTGRMLFWTNFGGKGIKKVYNCPLRRRPVSESVPVEDFIVSHAMSDLSNAARITHAIKMRPSVLRRMQLMGAYRDIPLTAAMDDSMSNPVEQGKADMAGVQPNNAPSNPKDIDHRLYETLCELDLDEFSPEQFRGSGLPLPYKVTIEKESRKVLEVRRNWKEDDEECQAKEYYVGYSFIEANGFYSIGLLGILGNLTRTLTAIQCEFVDAGMRATFPSFLYSKGMGRQNTNNFIVGPGQGVGLDTGLKDIREAAMPFPFKDLGPGFVAYAQHLEEYGKALGGTANMQVGEGKQDAPVGTTLALIEQQTKVTGSVLKGYHQSQQKELQLLKERFREDPGAFRRFNKRPSADWQEEQFLKALDDYDLVPVSDPNNPTRMHRLGKANMLYQMAAADPAGWKKNAVYKRVASEAELGSIDDLLAPEQAQGAATDPFAEAAMADVKVKAMGQQQKALSDEKKLTAEMADRMAERASRERIEESKRQQSILNLASTMAIHSSDAESKAAERATALADNIRRTDLEAGKHAVGVAADLHSQERQRQHDAGQQHFDRIHAERQSSIDRAHEMTQNAQKLHHQTGVEHMRSATKLRQEAMKPRKPGAK